MSRVRRVNVGASGSPGSFQVLRYAQRLARDLGATLVAVLAWLPPDGDLADRRTPCEELRRLWGQDGRTAADGRFLRRVPRPPGRGPQAAGWP